MELFEHSIKIKDIHYTLKINDIKNKVFNSHFVIEKLDKMGNGDPVALLSCDPIAGILPPDCGVLKIVNKFLYQDGIKIIELVQDLITGFDLIFKGITRYDVAIDFKTFWNGRTVPYFFSKVLRGEWLKEKCLSLHLRGKTTRGINTNYMRFGSNTSALQIILYDKTKEMNERTFKPYIVDRWKDNGFDVDTTTYRLEFSLSPNKYGIVDGDTGEVLKDFNSIKVCNDDFIENVLWTLVNQHFIFCVDDGQVKKSRMERVKLFTGEAVNTKYHRVVEKEKSNRVQKMILKYLYGMAADWRNEGLSLEDCIENEVTRFGLEDWANGNLGLKKFLEEIFEQKKKVKYEGSENWNFQDGMWVESKVEKF